MLSSLTNKKNNKAFIHPHPLLPFILYYKIISLIFDLLSFMTINTCELHYNTLSINTLL